MAAQLPEIVLCLVTDRSVFDTGAAPPEPRLIDAARQAVAGGANMIQLREKGLPGRELLSLALELRKVTAGRALLIVSDRVDIAIAAGADGVQLSEQSISVTAARRVCGRRLLLGRSVHDAYGAQDAERDGADFIIAGTVFASRSHPGLAAGGTGLISEICANVSVPVFGIGGVTPANTPEMMAAGATGIAVIGAILDSGNHRAAAEELAAAAGVRAQTVSDGRPQ